MGKNRTLNILSYILLYNLSVVSPYTVAHEVKTSVKNFKKSENNYEHIDQIFHLKLAHGEVNIQPQIIKVSQDDVICFVWESDEIVTLHLHGYDIEFELNPSKTSKVTFKASSVGRFPLSNHSLNKKQGYMHHALLYLEVYPN